MPGAHSLPAGWRAASHLPPTPPARRCSRLLTPRPADPRISLQGTMTWGEQNTEEEAWEQLDYALQQGVNFIDTGKACRWRAWCA